MHDPNDDDVDRAYRAAAASQPDDDGARRRRGAVLEAVRALEGEAADAALAPGSVRGPAPDSRRAAANEARWSLSGAGWRGAVAACLIVSTALVVVRLREEPGTVVEPQRTPLAAGGSAARSEEQARVPDAVSEALPAARPATRPAAAPARRPVPAAVPAPVAAPVTPPVTPPVSPPVAPSPAAPAAPFAGPPITLPLPVPAARPAPQPPPDGVFSATQAMPPAELRDQDAPAARAPAPAAASVGKARAEGSSTANRWADTVGEGSPKSFRRAPARSHPDAERDVDGRTALALAVLRGNVPLVKWLLAHGAQPQVPDRFGQTPLDYAEAGGDPAMRQAFQGP